MWGTSQAAITSGLRLYTTSESESATTTHSSMMALWFLLKILTCNDKILSRPNIQLAIKKFIYFYYVLFEMKVKGDVNQSYVEINIVILLRPKLFP